VEQGASPDYNHVTGQKDGPAHPFEEHHHFFSTPTPAVTESSQPLIDEIVHGFGGIVDETRA
jgi:hypothetical protein